MPLHEFVLVYDPIRSSIAFDDVRFDAIKAAPPVGCAPAPVGRLFGLECARTGPSKLGAIGSVVAEVREEHGLLLNDAGIEKLWEWKSDGRDGEGAEILAQLLLMAVHRSELIGYSAEELVRFIRAVEP